MSFFQTSGIDQTGIECCPGRISRSGSFEAIPPHPERPEWDFREHRTNANPPFLVKTFRQIPLFVAPSPKSYVQSILPDLRRTRVPPSQEGQTPAKTKAHTSPIRIRLRPQTSRQLSESDHRRAANRPSTPSLFHHSTLGFRPER